MSLIGHLKKFPEWSFQASTWLVSKLYGCSLRGPSNVYLRRVIGSRCRFACQSSFRSHLRMGFLKKIMFWRKRRGNVSPTMVDASVSTLVTSKCDVGTNTEEMVVEDDLDSNQEPPPVEYAEGCDQLPYLSPPQWPQPYEYYMPHQYEWGQWYSYGAPEYAEWCDTYAYNSHPAYPPEWSHVTPM